MCKIHILPKIYTIKIYTNVLSLSQLLNKNNRDRKSFDFKIKKNNEDTWLLVQEYFIS